MPTVRCMRSPDGERSDCCPGWCAIASGSSRSTRSSTPCGPTDAPSGPVAALQTQVFRLRKLLAFPGAPTIVTTPTGYQLELGEATTDAGELERAVDSAATAEPAMGAEALEAALASWRGPPFAGAEDVESLWSEQIRLEELHAQAVELHAAALVASGRANRAITELEPFLAEWPLRPQACATLMRALAAVGRDADAVRVYQEHRRQLVEELGLEPSPELRRLEASILRGELVVDDEPVGSDDASRAPGGPTIDALSITRLSRNGMRLAWAELGAGPPVLVLPAWVSSLDVIVAGRDPRSALIERLADRHRVITYDRRGTGLSGGDVVDFGIDAAVDELEAMVELVGERVALVGISGAGPIAVAFAVRRPERVSHLALFGTYASGPATFGDIGRPMLDLLRQRPTMAIELLAGLYRPGASPAAAIHLAQALRDSASTEIAAGYLEAIYETDVAHLVPKVRAPALVLHYRRDRVIPFAGGEALAAALPSVRFVPKDGAWHLPDRCANSWPPSPRDGGDVAHLSGRCHAPSVGTKRTEGSAAAERLAAGERDHAVAAVVQHQRRGAHLGDQVGDVGLVDRLEVSRGGLGRAPSHAAPARGEPWPPPTRPAGRGPPAVRCPGSVVGGAGRGSVGRRRRRSPARWRRCRTGRGATRSSGRRTANATAMRAGPRDPDEGHGFADELDDRLELVDRGVDAEVGHVTAGQAGAPAVVGDDPVPIGEPFDERRAGISAGHDHVEARDPRRARPAPVDPCPARPTPDASRCGKGA